MQPSSSKFTVGWLTKGLLCLAVKGLMLHRMYDQEISKSTLNAPCLERKDPRTRRPGQRTKDQRTKKPKDQGTRGPRDQRTKGPKDQKTRRPKYQWTTGPRDQDKGSNMFFLIRINPEYLLKNGPQFKNKSCRIPLSTAFYVVLNCRPF